MACMDDRGDSTEVERTTGGMVLGMTAKVPSTTSVAAPCWSRLFERDRSMGDWGGNR